MPVGERGDCHIGFCKQVLSSSGSVVKETIQGCAKDMSIKVLDDHERDTVSLKEISAF